MSRLEYDSKSTVREDVRVQVSSPVKMKKQLFSIIFVAIFSAQVMYAADYQWDLINALVKNDFPAVEDILKTNMASMTASDKMLVMNFAINYSSGENTVKALELLLKYNIRPGGFDLYTALGRNRQNSVIQFMLQNGAAPNGEILLLAMEKQRFDLAKQFIELGVDVNYQYPLSKNYADGMTPLLYAAKWNNFEMVKILVEHGAHINIQAVNGSTALSIARLNGNEPMYNFLRDRGAAEPGSNAAAPPQGSGISSLLDNAAAINLQRGTFRLSGGNLVIKLSGNANTGTIDYVKNGRAQNGVFKIEGNDLSLTLEGRTVRYKIDSYMSFSGNGEMWVRVGD